jgi:type VI secretion system secreted protein Hcp
MAVDMFIKIDGIKGEATDKDHKDEIDVLAWSWGESNSGSMSTGGGGGSGKVAVQDLTITKWLDKASPELMKACASGKHIKEAILVVRKAGGKPLEYLKITMSDLLVSSISTGGSGGEDRLTENTSFNFSAIKFEYVEQKADGSPGANFPFKYDAKKNTVE